jgi:hypothetical protein
MGGREEVKSRLQKTIFDEDNDYKFKLQANYYIIFPSNAVLATNFGEL